MLETRDERRIITTLSASGSIPDDPLQDLVNLAQPGLDDLVEAMIAWTQAQVGREEIALASERFALDNGKAFHDDSFYDARTTYFFDHLLFERPVTTFSGAARSQLPVKGATPYELFLAYARSGTRTVPQELLDRLTWLGDFRHSVFQVVRLNERSMVVQDVLTPGKIQVAAKAHETFRGLDKKHLMQGFLFRVGDEHHLSSGLVLHPPKAARLIKRFLKRGQKAESFSRRSALARLASTHIRYLRHRHVDPKSIYQTDLE